MCDASRRRSVGGTPLNARRRSRAAAAKVRSRRGAGFVAFSLLLLAVCSGLSIGVATASAAREPGPSRCARAAAAPCRPSYSISGSLSGTLLTSFAFNTGVNKRKYKTLIRLLQQGNLDGVPGYMRTAIYGTVTKKIKGKKVRVKVVIPALQRRRAAEANRFASSTCTCS